MGSTTELTPVVSRYNYQPFDVHKPPELGGEGSAPNCYPVAIIGAGPVGLTAALDLATRGIPTVVLDDNNVVSLGSRAICWSKRTLEIFDRLGVGERMLNKGVTWKTGRLFHKDDEVYHFDLLPEPGHKYPAFINLQQYYVEQYLIERCQEFSDLIDLRFKNTVTAHTSHSNHASLSVQTPFGSYTLKANYVLACDGAGSATRKRLDLPFTGQTFDEHFLIADVEMHTSPFKTDTPERWFWFEPSFHPGQSALLHKQPDNIYRIDLQLGPESDPKVEADEQRVKPRIKAMVGDTPFTFDWLSVYRFSCAKLDNFIHERIIFVGDSAHVVSPFGARGGNGGIQDVDNLCWKLALVLKGKSPESLLETYNEERNHGAAENIQNSARATNFMTPKSSIEYLFRNEVLQLARRAEFARKLINSGRLSVPCTLKDKYLQTQNKDYPMVGQSIKDAPLLVNTQSTWLINELPNTFTWIGIGNVELPAIAGTRRMGINQTNKPYPVFSDVDGRVVERFGDSCIYLTRPDGHICAAFSHTNKPQMQAAYARACGEYLRENVA